MFKIIQRRLALTRFLYLHRLSRSVIESWQVRYFDRLVRHAATHVPFYRDLFGDLNTAQSGIQSVADIHRIPITNKAMFLERPWEDYLDGSRPVRSMWKRTSGTSGEPLSLVVSALLLNRPYLDFASFRFLLGPLVSLKVFDTVRIAHINVRGKDSPNRFFTTIQDFLSRPDDVLRKIALHKPDIITSYTSIVYELAQKARHHPGLFEKAPRYVVTFGEMLTPATRKFIEETWQCEVYDRYGGGEIGAVAVECAAHNGMHVNSESAVVEIVDDDGKPVPEGAWGRVIVTDLLNYNMPFIRYEIGDRGKLITSTCSCGLETPRLHILGRYSAFITIAGRKVHHLEFDGALDGMMNSIMQYQVVKTGDENLMVRIVPGPLFSHATLHQIEKKIRGVVGGTISLSITSVTSIPKTLRGKSIILSDESLQETHATATM